MGDIDVGAGLGGKGCERHPDRWDGGRVFESWIPRQKACGFHRANEINLIHRLCGIWTKMHWEGHREHVIAAIAESLAARFQVRACHA